MLAFFIATSQRRNRWKACQELGIEPKLKEWDGKGSLVSFVVSLNLKRRHLTPSQGAAVAVEAKPFYDAEAKERQNEALAKGREMQKNGLLKDFSNPSDDEKEQSKGRLLLRSFNDPNLSDEEKEELSQIPYRLTPAEKAVMAVRVLPELEEASDKKWAKRVANSLMASTQVAKGYKH